MAPREDFVVERHFSDVSQQEDVKVQVRKGELLIVRKEDTE